MNGEGTGGGGAVVALLAVWVVAVAFVMVNRGTDESAEQPEPSGVVVVTDPTEDSAAADTRGGSGLGLDCEPAGTCDDPVTRAQVAAALTSAFQFPETGDDFFVDDDGAELEAEINRLAAAGVTSGCGSERYCPDAEIDRGQLASMLARTLELPQPATDHFDDDADSAHEAAINRLAEAGITDGCGDRAYCPASPVTHRQLMAFLQRALEFSASP